MGFCTNCGSQIGEGIKFCTNCGASVVTTQSVQQNTVLVQPSAPEGTQADTKAKNQKSPKGTKKKLIISLVSVFLVIAILAGVITKIVIDKNGGVAPAFAPDVLPHEAIFNTLTAESFSMEVESENSTSSAEINWEIDYQIDRENEDILFYGSVSNEEAELKEIALFNGYFYLCGERSAERYDVSSLVDGYFVLNEMGDSDDLGSFDAQKVLSDISVFDSEKIKEYNLEKSAEVLGAFFDILNEDGEGSADIEYQVTENEDDTLYEYYIDFVPAVSALKTLLSPIFGEDESAFENLDEIIENEEGAEDTQVYISFSVTGNYLNEVKLEIVSDDDDLLEEFLFTEYTITFSSINNVTVDRDSLDDVYDVYEEYKDYEEN